MQVTNPLTTRLQCKTAYITLRSVLIPEEQELNDRFLKSAKSALGRKQTSAIGQKQTVKI